MRFRCTCWVLMTWCLYQCLFPWHSFLSQPNQWPETVLRIYWQTRLLILSSYFYWETVWTQLQFNLDQDSVVYILCLVHYHCWSHRERNLSLNPIVNLFPLHHSDYFFSVWMLWLGRNHFTDLLAFLRCLCARSHR